MVLYPFESINNIDGFIGHYSNFNTYFGKALLKNHTVSFYQDTVFTIPSHAIAYFAKKMLDTLRSYIKIGYRFDSGVLLNELQSDTRGPRLEFIFKSLEKALLFPKKKYPQDNEGNYYEFNFESKKKLSNYGYLNVIYLIMKRLVDDSYSPREIELISSFLKHLRYEFKLNRAEYHEHNDWDAIVDYFLSLKVESSYVNYNERMEYRDDERFSSISYRIKEYKQAVSFDDTTQVMTFETRDRNIYNILLSIFSGENIWPLLRYNLSGNSQMFKGFVSTNMDELRTALKNVFSLIYFFKKSTRGPSRVLSKSYVTIDSAMEYEYLLGLNFGVGTAQFKEGLQIFLDTAKMFDSESGSPAFEYLITDFPFLEIKSIASFTPGGQNPFINSKYFGIRGSADFPVRGERSSDSSTRGGASAGIRGSIVDFTVQDPSSGGASASMYTVVEEDPDPIETYFAMYFC
jgi:hypothetical protein